MIAKFAGFAAHHDLFSEWANHFQVVKFDMTAKSFAHHSCRRGSWTFEAWPLVCPMWHSLWPATQRHTCKGWWKPIPLWCLRQRVVCTDVVFGNVRLQQPGWRIHQCTRLSISRWRVQACGYICRISKQFLPPQHWNYFFAVSNSCRHTGFQRTGKHRKHTHTNQ